MGALSYSNLPVGIYLFKFLVCFNFACFITAFRWQNKPQQIYANVQQEQAYRNLNTNPYWHREILDSRGNYQLEWLVDWDKERVIFNVTVATKGYVGFGLARNSKMEGADIVIGGVTPFGKAYFSDRHAVGNQQPILDKSQDWVLHSARESWTHTYLSFSRPFDTCDQNDIPIDDNSLYLLWAYGERDDIGGQYHNANRGSFVAYIKDADLTPRIVHEANQKYLVNGGEFGSAPVFGAQVWSMREQFTIPAKRTTYWCNVKKFSPPTPGKKHMIGYNVWLNPEAVKHMHHMFLLRCPSPPGMSSSAIFDQFLDHPGQECYRAAPIVPPGSIPTQLCYELKLGHAIGGKPTFFPQHVGVPLGETNQDEYYILQIHYDNPDFARVGTVNTTLQWDVYYTENLRQNDAGFLSVGHNVPGSPSILVPPGEPDHKVYGHCSPSCTSKMFPPEGIKITFGLMHSHLAGRKTRVHHFRNGKELPWIMNDDNYKFGFQTFRLLREDVTVLPGDQLTFRCTYDTTTANMTTVGGYGTEQEMCQFFPLYYGGLDNYPLCRSEIISQEYMMRYLAGANNVTWDVNRLEFVATSPANLAGMTLSEISDSQYVNWDDELRGQLRRDHIVHPQVEVCPNMREVTAGIPQAPPGSMTFPVQVTEYVPLERCTLNEKPKK